MKKIMAVLIMVVCTSAFAQEGKGLEQFYQQNGSDATPTRYHTDYNDMNSRQDRCVNPTDNYNYNDDAMGEGRYNNWSEVDPENCLNDPAACNCINHGGKNGQLSHEPIHRGSECVPVQVYDWNAGEKMWHESGEEYPLYWCEPIQEETHRGNYNDDALEESQDWNYEHPDYWKTRNPEAGDPDYIKNKDDDGLQRRGGGPQRG